MLSSLCRHCVVAGQEGEGISGEGKGDGEGEYRNRQTAMSDGAQTVRGMGVLCVKLTKCRLVGSDEE